MTHEDLTHEDLARDVRAPFDAIEFKPYQAGDLPDLVTALVDADRLAILTQRYRTAAWDEVILPMSSGCASIARIPLGELRSAALRAVIGNCDRMPRQFFDPSTFFFTTPGVRFAEMLTDADRSFLGAPMFSGVKKRL
ncbi:MAG: hypothetical protein LBT14_12450 [Treponema sp.]|jgi:hypothetical protein|nr:hypothetical protein [Treponema sp.]